MENIYFSSEMDCDGWRDLMLIENAFVTNSTEFLQVSRWLRKMKENKFLADFWLKCVSVAVNNRQFSAQIFFLSSFFF